MGARGRENWRMLTRQRHPKDGRMLGDPVLLDALLSEQRDPEAAAQSARAPEAPPPTGRRRMRGKQSA